MVWFAVRDRTGFRISDARTKRPTTPAESLQLSHTTVVALVLWTITAWLAAFGTNAAPALMPPSWTVLAAFYIGFDLPLLPLMIGSAVASALGRVTLTWLTARASGALPERGRREAAALGRWTTRPPTGRWWLVAVGYFVGPFPSNVPFIAAGAGGGTPWTLALAFAFARLVSDTLWVWAAGKLATDATDFLTERLTDWPAVLMQLIGAAAVIALFFVPWSRWLHID